MGSNGLKKQDRRVMGVIVGSLIGLGTMLPGMAASAGVVLPSLVYLMVGIAAFVAYNIKLQYDIKADVSAAASGPTTPAWSVLSARVAERLLQNWIMSICVLFASLLALTRCARISSFSGTDRIPRTPTRCKRDLAYCLLSDSARVRVSYQPAGPALCIREIHNLGPAVFQQNT